MKNYYYYYKRKQIVNHLINLVEEVKSTLRRFFEFPKYIMRKQAP